MKRTSFFRLPVCLGVSAAVVLLHAAIGSAQLPPPGGGDASLNGPSGGESGSFRGGSPGGGPGGGGRGSRGDGAAGGREGGTPPPSPGGPPGGGGAPAAKPQIISFAGSDGRWAWLRRVGETVELFQGTAAGEKTLLAKGSDWREVALTGETAWLLRSEGGRGELLSLPIGAPGTPKAELTGLRAPQGLLAEGDRLFWLERAEGAPLGPVFIPAAASGLRLMTRQAGQTRVLSEWPAAEIPPGEMLGFTPGTRVVGLGDGAVFVQETGITSTTYYRVPETGGEAQRVAAASGMQQGVVHESVLYWTAPSEEASNFDVTASIHRLRPGGKPETLTDWLRMPVALLKYRGGVAVSAEGLFRLPEQLGPAELIDARAMIPGGTTSDGTHIVLLHEADGPLQAQ
ncbi:MAG: hypothetical protein ACK47B_04125 [Armatimonadota bacterium]